MSEYGNAWAFRNVPSAAADSAEKHSSDSETGSPLRIALKKLGITKRLTVHGMRRTYNNLMRQAETDTVVVQAMTGHSDGHPFPRMRQGDGSSRGIDPMRSAWLLLTTKSVMNRLEIRSRIGSRARRRRSC
ncbi:MAG: hypothetical protein FJ087_03065 [Deltaproteobacteria bacterium]|nr:hypothetical protein [Deltaproteobacteria bacterium]